MRSARRASSSGPLARPPVDGADVGRGDHASLWDAPVQGNRRTPCDGRSDPKRHVASAGCLFGCHPAHGRGGRQRAIFFLCCSSLQSVGPCVALGRVFPTHPLQLHVRRPCRGEWGPHAHAGCPLCAPSLLRARAHRPMHRAGCRLGNGAPDSTGNRGWAARCVSAEPGTWAPRWGGSRDEACH